MTAQDAAHDSTSPVPAPADELRTVRILGLPLAVQARAQEQAEALTRELTFIGARLRQDGNARDLPARLVDLVDRLTARYSVFSVEQEQQIVEAIEQDQDSIDLTYRLPASAAAAAQALSDILDEADDYCRAGQLLLTLATPDDLVAYRRWFLSEFTGQLAGQPPLAWDDYLRQRAI